MRIAPCDTAFSAITPTALLQVLKILCIWSFAAEDTPFISAKQIDVYKRQDGERLQEILGLDSYTTDSWDYYITDTSVVFFYYDPRYWDSVAARRMR